MSMSEVQIISYFIASVYIHTYMFYSYMNHLILDQNKHINNIPFTIMAIHVEFHTLKYTQVRLYKHLFHLFINNCFFTGATAWYISISHVKCIFNYKVYRRLL